MRVQSWLVEGKVVVLIYLFLFFYLLSFYFERGRPHEQQFAVLAMNVIGYICVYVFKIQRGFGVLGRTPHF